MTFTSLPIDFKISKTLNPLVTDFVNKEDKIKPFYENFADSIGFNNILKTVANQQVDRHTLVQELTIQSTLVNNTTLITKQNIE